MKTLHHLAGIAAVAASVTSAAEASFVLHSNFPTWLNYVNGPVVDPGIFTAFSPANGTEQPVPPDMFAGHGLLLHAWQDITAHQVPWAPSAYYISTGTPGASLEVLFTTPVSAAFLSSGINFPVQSDHGYLIQFFAGDTLLGQSTVFGTVGAISTVPFDRVVLAAPLATDIPWLSNVWFAPIPGPGGAAVLLGALAFAPRRRRHEAAREGLRDERQRLARRRRRDVHPPRALAPSRGRHRCLLRSKRRRRALGAGSRSGRRRGALYTDRPIDGH